MKKKEIIEINQDEILALRMLGTLMNSGVPVLQALTICQDLPARFGSTFKQIHDDVRDGDTMAGTLVKASPFHDHVTTYIQIGEETGDLPAMLFRAANLIQPELNPRYDQNDTEQAKVHFYNHLSSHVNAGIPLVRGLALVANTDYIPRSVTSSIAETINGGSTFAEALSKQDAHFSRFEMNVAKAGELGGVLDRNLAHLANYLDQKYCMENPLHIGPKWLGLKITTPQDTLLGGYTLR